MSKVAQPTVTRKAYRAILFEEPGLLFQHADGRILFLADATDRLTTIEPEMCMWLTVLGRCDLYAAQRLEDLHRGGAVGVALTRAQGVA